ncbi:hypothetical protein ACFWAY_53150 [Rhodococcus sp. NPDC059968]
MNDPTGCLPPYYEIYRGGPEVEDTVVVSDGYKTVMSTGRHLWVLEIR